MDSDIASIEKRLAAVERSRRRERAIGTAVIAMLLVGLYSWSPAAQPQKPLDQRVEDLEKRFGGAGGIGEAMRIRAPFVVTDQTGRSLFSVTTDADSALVMVGPATEPGVTLSLDPTSTGYVNVRGKGGEPAIGIGGKPAGVRVFAPNGGDVVASLGLDEGNNGELQIGDPKGGGAEIGMGGTSGAGVVLVRRQDGGVGAGVGQLRGGPMSMVVFNGDKEAAALSSDKIGGRVRVMNAAGLPVGGLQADAAGGRLALTASGGGNSLVSIGATNAGIRELETALRMNPDLAVARAWLADATSGRTPSSSGTNVAPSP